MDFLWHFLLGAFFGWAIEFVIDRFYWRGLGTKPLGDSPFAKDLSSLRTRFDDSQEKLAASETEIERLKSLLTVGIPSDALELHNQLEEARKEIEALKATKIDSPTDTSLQQELAEAKSMIERLQSENENTSPLVALNELQSKLDEAETELAGYRSVEEITRIEIQDLRQKLSDAEAKVASAPKGKGAAAANEELTALKHQLEEKEQTIQDLLAKVNAAPAPAGGAEFETLRSRANQSDYFASQLETARATIATLEQEMIRQPAASSTASDELVAQNRQLEDAVRDLRTSLDSREAELDNLRQALDAKQHEASFAITPQELDDWKARAEQAEERATALMTDRQHGIEELESLRKQLANITQSEDQSHDLRQQIEDLSVKLASRDQAVTDMRSEVNMLTARLHTSQTELEDFRTTRSSQVSEVQSLRDEVANLKFEASRTQEVEAKLKEAEIELEAYNDLKAAKEQLQDRVGQLEGELSDAKNAARSSEELQAQVAQTQQAAAEVSTLRAHLEHHRTALAQALAQLDALPGAPSPIPAVFAGAQPTTPPPVADRDPLEQIDGIGFVFERKLWDAGILTYHDLATATPEQIEEAVQPETWQNIDAQAWIDAAKKLSNGD